MFGIIAIAICVIFLAVAIIEASNSYGEPGPYITGFFMLGLFFVVFPFMFIASSPHDPKPESLGEKLKIESVDVQGDVYIFTLEDGKQVAKESEDVVVLGVSDDPGIQYGNEYYSWGLYWFGNDWLGDEVVVYTPSNKG